MYPTCSCATPAFPITTAVAQPVFSVARQLQTLPNFEEKEQGIIKLFSVTPVCSKTCKPAVKFLNKMLYLLFYELLAV
jgi:hypothetical protein